MILYVFFASWYPKTLRLWFVLGSIEQIASAAAASVATKEIEENKNVP